MEWYVLCFCGPDGAHLNSIPIIVIILTNKNVARASNMNYKTVVFIFDICLHSQPVSSSYYGEVGGSIENTCPSMNGENNMKKKIYVYAGDPKIYINRLSPFDLLDVFIRLLLLWACLLLKFFYQSELLSCKGRERKQTNISWPITKVKESHLQA